MANNPTAKCSHSILKKGIRCKLQLSFVCSRRLEMKNLLIRIGVCQQKRLRRRVRGEMEADTLHTLRCSHSFDLLSIFFYRRFRHTQLIPITFFSEHQHSTIKPIGKGSVSCLNHARFSTNAESFPLPLTVEHTLSHLIEFVCICLTHTYPNSIKHQCKFALTNRLPMRLEHRRGTFERFKLFGGFARFSSIFLCKAPTITIFSLLVFIAGMLIAW